MTSPLERDLREVLTARAESVPATYDPYGRTARAIAVDRRRRSVVMTAMVAVVTTLVIAPIVVLGTFDPASKNGTRSTTAARVRLPDVELVNWPLSGDLAGNREAVRQARTDLELAAQADVAVDGIQLLAVGSADPGPYLVGLAHSVPTRSYNYERVTVFVAGPGVAAASAVANLRTDEMARRDVLAHAVAAGHGGRDYLLVAARPGVSVQVSTGRRFGPDGTVARDYRPLPLRSGVAVTPLDANATDPTLRVRGYRGTALAYDSFVKVARVSPGALPDPQSVARLAREAGIGRGVLGGMLRTFATKYGLDLGDAHARVVWRGSVSGSTDTAAVLELQLGSGATFQLVVQRASESASRALLRQVRYVPSNSAARWPIAWVSSGDTIGCWLTVALPADGAERVSTHYVGVSRTVPGLGRAGKSVSIDRCLHPTGLAEPGVLTVANADTGAELLRWDLTQPDWVYERTDQL